MEIAARRVLTPDGVQGPGAVRCSAGYIEAVSSAPRGRVDGELLVPGLIDLQVNGIGPVDVAHAAIGEWPALDEALLSGGVTSWCPTIISQPLDAYRRPLDTIAEAAARPGPVPQVIGAHLEGPFLTRPGAHDPSRFVDPAPDALDIPEVVSLVTLAPERPMAMAAIEALTRRGITVALGHTDADAATMSRAVDAGARLVTHLFNAMPPFHHRDPGPAGAALADDRLFVSVIADGEHVDLSVVKAVFRAKPYGKVVLVSDQVSTSGMASGRAPRAAGVLAGAVAPLLDGVRNVTAYGIGLAEGFHAATGAPARALGLDDRGAIARNMRADLVLLDADLSPLRVWVGGREAWSA